MQGESPDSENIDVSKAEENKRLIIKEGETMEPYVGMEYESEDDARKFYTDYATRVGFVARIAQPSRAENIGGKNITRSLVCNKHGISLSPKGKMGPERKPRPGMREDCNARIVLKVEESGKWVVSRFFKNHNHALDLHDKDNKIHKLKGELRRQEEVFAGHRERFISLLADIEKQVDWHFSPKVLAVVENVKKAEAEALVMSKA